MKSRTAGLLVIGIALLIGIVVYLFNAALTTIVATSCEHGPACPMWGTINFETSVGLAIMVLVIIAGMYLVFFAKDEKPLVPRIKIMAPQATARKPTREAYRKVLAGLDAESRAILEKIIDGGGTALQSALVEATDMNKVKVTRVLDRLEAQDLVERRRRGMTNVVVLKNK